MRKTLLFAAALFMAGPSAAALAQPAGAFAGDTDCFAHWFTDAQFTSTAAGGGRFFYAVQVRNSNPDHAVRYSYSFALPGTARPAEALHGVLMAGTDARHGLGTGDRDLGSRELRAATVMRCARN